MLTIKNAADIEKMKAAGRLTEDVLKLMAEMAKPGELLKSWTRPLKSLYAPAAASPPASAITDIQRQSARR